MKKIKQAYYYLYYRLYKHSQSSIFSNDYAATVFLYALWIFFLFSIFNYYSLFTNTNQEVNKVLGIIIYCILIVIPNYFIFHYNDKWKIVVKEFDKLPKEKNKKYGIIVWSIIILIIGNMLFSFYLLFAQAKKDQTGPYAPEIVAKERKEDSLQKAQQIEKLKKIYGEDKK
ncbi:hypothetical protein [Chryseobacterium sp. EO14]|uniref:hypothetical protein n=1 Tax=Chryseobacterium sp. EO14 TaxID=2950551 RepID=UPI00210EB243|nr:hypothetical protein [Chryseobacterium sp. EO14]MCQ4138771.1 hypothetical protein [Chryseobacterium sp. EO14]